MILSQFNLKIKQQKKYSSSTYTPLFTILFFHLNLSALSTAPNLLILEEIQGSCGEESHMTA